jgi:CRISPR/Cas system CSM-associated protein Csm3 (group 7 of RAMP superfamily)
MKPQRLDVAFVLMLRGPWHVGSGLGSVAIDRLLRRRALPGTSERVPYVPGSQLKGILRHQCERLLATFSAPVLSPHFLSEQPTREYLAAFVPLQQSDYLIDRLFGSRYEGECLFVQDALPESNLQIPSYALNRTAMDRLTGTVRAGRLFTTELASGKAITLRSVLQARHVAGVLTPQDGDDEGFPYEYSFLLAGLLSMDAIGGDKSTGCGWIQMQIQEILWNGKKLPLETALAPLQDSDWLDMMELIRSELREKRKATS